MEFCKKGEKPQLDTIYDHLNGLLKETDGVEDFVGTTGEYELTTDDLWATRDILAKPELPAHLQNAQNITLFHQEAEGEPGDLDALPECYVVSVDDGELTILYGFYKTEEGYGYDKSVQSTVEVPAAQFDERTLGGAILELTAMPTPGAWAATLVVESGDRGDFSNPNNWQRSAPLDLEEIARRTAEQERLRALEAFTPAEFNAFSELLQRLSAQKRYPKAS